MRVLIDTHIWIWWLMGQTDLRFENRARLDALAKKSTPPYLSAISLWEAQMLAKKARLTFDMAFPDWLLQASDPEVVTVGRIGNHCA